MERGRDLLKSGDVGSARLGYNQLANAGIAEAALALAATYESRYLAQRNFIGVAGDETNAHDWYQLAASSAGADAPEVEICSLVAKPSNFDRQTITFRGKVTAVKKTTSRRGNDYTLFKLQGTGACGGAIDVFIWGHPKISDGDQVRVEGVFETVHHQDRSVFYNQLEATRVVPVMK